MHLLVGFAVVCLLKELVGADLRFVQFTVVFNGRRRDVDVHAPDRTVFVLDRVNRLDGLKDVLNRVVLGVLAGFQKKPLVTQVLQRNHLPADIVLGELLADDVLVFGVVRAVCAGVDAVVGEVQGREKNDALTVDVFLHLNCGLHDFFIAVGKVAGQKHRRFAVGEPLKGKGLINERFNQRSVGLMFFGVRKRVLNLLMVDEVIGLTRFGIVHGDLSATSAVS